MAGVLVVQQGDDDDLVVPFTEAAEGMSGRAVVRQYPTGPALWEWNSALGNLIVGDGEVTLTTVDSSTWTWRSGEFDIRIDTGQQEEVAGPFRIRVRPMLSGETTTPPTGPSPVYLTKTETLLAIGQHNASSTAHTDIRNLIAIGGGAGGAAATLTDVRPAATILSGHRVVTPTSTGSVRYADATTLTDVNAPLWVTIASAASGSEVPLVMAGDVIESSWSWTRGPVYLAADGQLTQTVPSRPGAAFLARVGSATSATVLNVDRQPSVVLA